jgi:hypothetical protein
MPKDSIIEQSNSIIALVLYTGNDTKIKQAKTHPIRKQSRFDGFFLKIFFIYIIFVGALGLATLLI